MRRNISNRNPFSNVCTAAMLSSFDAPTDGEPSPDVLATHFNTGDLTLTGELDSTREEVNQDLLSQGHGGPADRQVTRHEVNPPPYVCSA